MKKILFAIAAVALLFATSCKKESVNPAVDVPEGSFLATIDNGANPQNAPVVKDGMGTMTTIDANRYVIWDNGDQIKINGELYTTNTTGSSVVFDPVDMTKQATGTTFHAFFPATIAGTDNAGTLPATQTIEFDNQGNAKVNNLPMYATSNNNQLTFHNICAALKVTVPVACSEIRVSASTNLCGAFTVNNNIAELSDKTGSSNNTITVTGSFAENQVVYVAIPAGTYNGINITLMNGTTRIYTTGAKTDGITVAANKMYQISLPPACLCFTARTAGSTVKINSDNMLDFSVDGTSFGNYTSGQQITLANVGDKVYFKARSGITNTKYDRSFYTSGDFDVSGNLLYLINEDLATANNFLNSIQDNQSYSGIFRNLFKECDIVNAKDLILPPTNTMAMYETTFHQCTKLETAPVLEADIVRYYCYCSMFNTCSKLSEVRLKATGFVAHWYIYDISQINPFTNWLLNAGTDQSVTTRKVIVDNNISTALYNLISAKTPSTWAIYKENGTYLGNGTI